MNKLFKRALLLIFASAALGALCVSCNNDSDDPKEEPLESRTNVIGDYEVRVAIESLDRESFETVTITEEGLRDLRATVKMTIENVGTVDISLALSALKEFTSIDGIDVTGYYFKVEEQNITAIGQTMPCKGTGAFEGGYDGIIYKNDSKAFFSATLSTIGMVIDIETAE